jgi:hypothetical protein
MNSFRSKPVGWRYESHRHALAAQGIASKRYFMPIRWSRRPNHMSEQEWTDYKRMMEKVTEAEPSEFQLKNPGHQVNQFTKMNTVLGEDKEIKKLQRVNVFFRDDTWRKKYNEEAMEALKGQGYSEETVKEYLGERNRMRRNLADEMMKDPKMKELLEGKKRYEVMKSTKSGVLARVGSIRIKAERLPSGQVYPVTPQEVKEILETMPKEDLKGLKSVEFVPPRDKHQKAAWAQEIRSKKKILIFSQKASKDGKRISGRDAKTVREHIKSYVVPHEVGHYSALRTLPTDKTLAMAEARADAYAFGMDIRDRDAKIFKKFHE